jgi:hypothetical protein
MSRDHATGTVRGRFDNFDHCKSEEEIGRSFVKLDCFSHCAFPLRTADGGLSFPSRHDEFHVTGWEYLIAKKHGLIHSENIHSVISFDKTINFSPYVEKWFAHKQAAGKDDVVNYTIGKIMANSLYGKLAQDPLKYWDYEIHPPHTEVNELEGWELYKRFQGIDIHRRPASWNFVYKYGVDWVKRPLYFNVATGASITGFARSHLLDAIHTIGADRAIYCDTDSIAFLPTDTSRLSMGSELGQWEYEGKDGVGYFAGKKLYGIKFPNIEKPKIASKGCKLNYEQIKDVVNGKKVVWKNEAPSFSVAGGVDFVVREISSTV